MGRSSAGATGKSIGLRATAVAALLLGAGAWTYTDRAVTLRIDGVAQTVHTHADDVAGVLAAAGVTADQRDDLVPGPAAEVRRGDTISLDRARRLTITVDGRKRSVWVTAPTVDEALAELSLGDRRLRLSASRRTRLPLDGAALRVQTEKRVTLRADGRTATVVTYAHTVDDLLTQSGVTLDGDDRTLPPRTSLLTGPTAVVVQRIVIRTATETVTVPPPVQKRSDPDLMLDQKQVRSEGRSGRERQSVRYTYADGKLDARTVTARQVLSTSAPRVVVAGSKPYPADDTGLNWDALAQCESGGRAGVVSSNGTYHGLYQFNVDMWHRMGGIGVPSTATPREQTYRAIKLYKAAGADQWPVCGSRLFG